MSDELPDLDLPDEFRKGVAFAEACAADDIARLRAALVKHGRHTSDCRFLGGFDCDCGLQEALAYPR